ncbi:RNA lariat debranching enzyme, putative [Theileria equi strain WA]|uniref:RNA lariat debranching enzyme, putative n=1 Tax=Theileria equi strain WA TaxID=1537102 RepID=L0AV51_THEEQ|nr:RNA lariat debranching enzyme, putative [Theileria equi strain WA]AFZ79487.1 RNA lariat debranching enzyme, putative [Theileria equi strain WA]|eukprot:XP_004829153.1 RNA lariat debranching enzyme, putative [Theileria equi strain WA]
MNIAVEGCCHGELDKIYETILAHEQQTGIKVDLLLCCGDFQAVRDESDLKELICPLKYKAQKDFKQYYNGKKVAPVLTIFIGGNHEAPDLLRHLYYGGWVAPNIYYLGYSGIVNIAGLRIAGISGIYNQNNYTKGYYEQRPYSEDAKRSAYNVREFDVEKLYMIENELDIFMSHDWPAGIEHYGNLEALLRVKPYFVSDVRHNILGNPKTRKLLEKLQPTFWFSGHLHVKYEAKYKHEDGSTTHFLALDKVLPNRQFLKIMDVKPKRLAEGAKRKRNGDYTLEKVLCYDREWCAILVANRDRMPLNAFPSTTPITLNKPTEEDFRFVDEQFAKFGFEALSIGTLDRVYKMPSWDVNDYKNPKLQREKFQDMLNLPDNSFFNPNINTKYRVVRRE